MSSLGLWGIPDPARLFTEVRRVLRPGGQLLALEHVRPTNRWFGMAADLIDPVFDHLIGCHSNRPTADLLRASGFAVQVIERRLACVLVALRAVPGEGGLTLGAARDSKAYGGLTGLSAGSWGQFNPSLASLPPGRRHQPGFLDGGDALRANLCLGVLDRPEDSVSRTLRGPLRLDPHPPLS